MSESITSVGGACLSVGYEKNLNVESLGMIPFFMHSK